MPIGLVDGGGAEGGDFVFYAGDFGGGDFFGFVGGEGGVEGEGLFEEGGAFVRGQVEGEAGEVEAGAGVRAVEVEDGAGERGEGEVEILMDADLEAEEFDGARGELEGAVVGGLGGGDIGGLEVAEGLQFMRGGVPEEGLILEREVDEEEGDAGGEEESGGGEEGGEGVGGAGGRGVGAGGEAEEDPEEHGDGAGDEGHVDLVVEEHGECGDEEGDL